MHVSPDLITAQTSAIHANHYAARHHQKNQFICINYGPPHAVGVHTT